MNSQYVYLTNICKHDSPIEWHVAGIYSSEERALRGLGGFVHIGSGWEFDYRPDEGAMRFKNNVGDKASIRRIEVDEMLRVMPQLNLEGKGDGWAREAWGTDD